MTRRLWTALAVAALAGAACSDVNEQRNVISEASALDSADQVAFGSRTVLTDAGLLRAAEAVAADVKLAAVKTSRGERVPRAVTGVIVTGDAFVADPAKQEALRKEFKADATEMEGAAVAQVCWQRGVPCLILRSLSDDAGAKAPENERHFVKTAAENSALLVGGVVGRLGAK